MTDGTRDETKGKRKDTRTRKTTPDIIDARIREDDEDGDFIDQQS